MLNTITKLKIKSIINMDLNTTGIAIQKDMTNNLMNWMNKELNIIIIMIAHIIGGTNINTINIISKLSIVMVVIASKSMKICVIHFHPK